MGNFLLCDHDEVVLVLYRDFVTWIAVCTDCDKGKHPDEIYKWIMGKDFRTRWRKNIGEFYAEEGYVFPSIV